MIVKRIYSTTAKRDIFSLHYSLVPDQFLVSEAVCRVIIDHTYGLHVGINYS